MSIWQSVGRSVELIASYAVMFNSLRELGNVSMPIKPLFIR